MFIRFSSIRSVAVTCGAIGGSRNLICGTQAFQTAPLTRSFRCATAATATATTSGRSFHLGVSPQRPSHNNNDLARVASSLLVESKKNSSNTKSGIAWNINASKESLLSVATKAFAGSETTEPELGFEWVFRGVVPTEFNQERNNLYRFLLEQFLMDGLKKEEKQSFFFGHEHIPKKDSISVSSAESDEEEDSLASAVLLVEFDPSTEFATTSLSRKVVDTTNNVWPLVKAALFGRLPRPIVQNIRKMPSTLHRVDLFQDAMEHGHKEYGPSSKHLYVNMVAMDPSFQGMGFGKELMNQVSSVADAMGMDSYLECTGQRNPRFYEKFGFHVVHETRLVDPDDSGSNFPVYHMVRPAAK